MNDKPITQDLLNDEQLLRAEIGRVLNNSRGTHQTNDFMTVMSSPDMGKCFRCGKRLGRGRWTRHGIFPSTAPGCSVPNPWPDALEVAAERLKKMVNNPRRLREVCLDYTQNAGWDPEDTPSPDFMAEWFVWMATPAERCAVCIEALKTKGDMK